MPSQRVTIADVAARAGVSRTTVSHVLSGHRPVAPETRAAVFDVIEQLGYRPSELARSLSSRRTRTVALIIPDITNPFYPTLARGLQDVLKESDYHGMVCNTDADRHEEVTYLAQMVDRSVDGIVFVGFRTSNEDLRPAIDAGIPVVALGESFTTDTVDIVGVDDRRGSAEATDHLLVSGLRRVAFIGAQRSSGPGEVRLRGYEDALRHHGLETCHPLVVPTDYTREGGHAGMYRLLDLARPPRGVVCANDLIAIGVLDAARERGLAVPDDLAVIGFDDIEAATLTSPRLTTVVNPAYALGQASGRLLMSRLVGHYTGPPRATTLACRLVIRESA